MLALMFVQIQEVWLYNLLVYVIFSQYLPVYSQFKHVCMQNLHNTPIFLFRLCPYRPTKLLFKLSLCQFVKGKLEKTSLVDIGSSSLFSYSWNNTLKRDFIFVLWLTKNCAFVSWVHAIWQLEVRHQDVKLCANEA